MALNPLVTVIVPIYQSETTLKRCIESILSQSFEQIEVLLINDGSTDSSGKICEEYAQKDSRIKVFHKNNEGLSITRQFGIEHCCGEYTIQCDADDWIDSNMVEEMYSKAKECDADIVMCDVMMEYEKKSRICKQYTRKLDADSLMEVIYDPISASLCNKLIKRECYSNYGVLFSKDIEYGEDLYVMLQLLSHPVKVSYIPKALYHYDRYSNKEGLTFSLRMDKLKRSTDYMVAHLQDCPAIRKLKIDVINLAHRFHTHNFGEYDGLYSEMNYDLLKIGMKHPIKRWRCLVIALHRYHFVRISTVIHRIIECGKRIIK